MIAQNVYTLGRKPIRSIVTGKQLTKGWNVIFEDKKLDSYHVGSNCFRTPISKFHFQMLLFNLPQGTKKKYGACAEEGMSSLIFLKVK